MSIDSILGTLNEIESEEKGKVSFSQWMRGENNSYIAIGVTEPKMVAGFYNIRRDHRGNIIFVPQEIVTDEIINFKNSQVSEIVKAIDSFWDSEKKFKQYGFNHRRGVLLHGAQGCGKSSIIKILMHRLIKRDGIVLNCSDVDPAIVNTAIQVFRTIEPDRKIICLFEDLDQSLEYYMEAELLSAFDGEKSTEHVLNLATTNYPEKLPDTIKKRIRRFDMVVEIKLPDEKVRRKYFKHKIIDISNKELDDLVAKTKGFSFASMTEIVIGLMCFGHSLDSILDRLTTHMTEDISSDDYELNFNDSAGFKT